MRIYDSLLLDANTDAGGKNLKPNSLTALAEPSLASTKFNGNFYLSGGTYGGLDRAQGDKPGV